MRLLAFKIYKVQIDHWRYAGTPGDETGIHAALGVSRCFALKSKSLHDNYDEPNEPPPTPPSTRASDSSTTLIPTSGRQLFGRMDLSLFFAIEHHAQVCFPIRYNILCRRSDYESVPEECLPARSLKGDLLYKEKEAWSTQGKLLVVWVGKPWALASWAITRLPGPPMCTSSIKIIINNS